MSVRLSCPPPNLSLSGSEGELISVRISVEPRLLEELLEALAEIQFPINPQIYHKAATVYVYADGHRVEELTTMVEFPAFRGRLGEVQDNLRRHGFDPGSLHVKSMLDDLHATFDVDQAPPGAPYTTVVRYKHA